MTTPLRASRTQLPSAAEHWIRLGKRNLSRLSHFRYWRSQLAYWERQLRYWGYSRSENTPASIGAPDLEMLSAVVLVRTDKHRGKNHPGAVQTSASVRGVESARRLPTDGGPVCFCPY